MACKHFDNSPAGYLYGFFGSCFFSGYRSCSSAAKRLIIIIKRVVCRKTLSAFWLFYFFGFFFLDEKNKITNMLCPLCLLRKAIKATPTL